MVMASGIDLAQHIDIFQCPKCQGNLRLDDEEMRCTECNQGFPIDDDIPMLFWPDEADENGDDVVQTVKDFYEETPFPDYNDFDSVGSLVQKARQGIFARMLDEQVPPGVRVIECGCGTGQLSNFLSITNRTVFGTDMCMNSLRLGQNFAREHQLSRVRFVQHNLLRPAFKPESFHLVISNGVLMTTPDPFETFRTISELVEPGGYILIGLYHRYGRLVTDARRLLFNMTGDRFLSLDPNLRNESLSDARRRAWFLDQYKHPHEVKHTIGQAMGWLRDAGFTFVRSLPPTKLSQSISGKEKLFEYEEPGNSFERTLVELGMFFKGSLEGGFFNVIGRKDRS
ncbi:MAG: methyltransferase domain-containing protein [Myxococcota bacterium]|nr:methyltransferase domain-containing protein [Myxococcota bacterium]